MRLKQEFESINDITKVETGSHKCKDKYLRPLYWIDEIAQNSIFNNIGFKAVLCKNKDISEDSSVWPNVLWMLSRILGQLILQRYHEWLYFALDDHNKGIRTYAYCPEIPMTFPVFIFKFETKTHADTMINCYWPINRQQMLKDTKIIKYGDYNGISHYKDC